MNEYEERHARAVPQTYDFLFGIKYRRSLLRISLGTPTSEMPYTVPALIPLILKLIFDFPADRTEESLSPNPKEKYSKF